MAHDPPGLNGTPSLPDDQTDQPAGDPSDQAADDSGLTFVGYIDPASITLDPDNANIGSEEGMALLDESLERYGAGRSILLDANNIDLAGNKTLERAVAKGFKVAVVETDGQTLLAVRRKDLDAVNDPVAARGLATMDNWVGFKNLTWDYVKLASLAADPEAELEWAFSALDLEDFRRLAKLQADDDEGDGQDAEKATMTLAQRFIVPPFTILDSRQGYWLTRKRAWIALGIKSEIGRGDDGTDRAASYKGQDALNAIADQKRPSKPVPGGSGGGAWKHREADGQLHAAMAYPRQGGAQADSTPHSMQSGTSVFDPVLCEVVYRWFCPPYGRVLDPFAGGSVRGIVAGRLRLGYTGIDLREEQVNANYEQANGILQAADDIMPNWRVDDARNLDAQLGADDDPYDLVFTCPPYYDLELYSYFDTDLSNAKSYDQFLADLGAIIKLAAKRLRDDRFAAIVVGDIRDKRGVYRNFVGDTIRLYRDAGLDLYNEAIYVTPMGSLPVRAAYTFPKGRKLAKTHQNVLVFVKGDIGRANTACGPLQIDTEIIEEQMRAEIATATGQNDA